MAPEPTAATPLISILTVSRDHAAGLTATRASLLRQGFRDFEWIVADGGSTDGSVDRLRGWAGEDPALRWDSRTDNGPFDAMNRAMAEAKGRWLLFLNAGDRLIDGDVLADLAAIAVRPDAPALIFGDSVEDEALQPGLSAHPTVRRARTPRYAALGMFAHHGAILYRRDTTTGLRYRTDLRIAADYAFTLEVLRDRPQWHYLRRVIVRFEAGGRSRLEADLGRMEQHTLRQEILEIPILASSVIFLGQLIAHHFRITLPGLYASLRFRPDLPD